MKPPLTPEAQLQRVLRTAKFNGLCLVIIAGLGLLLSLGDWFGMAVCLAIVGGGWMELSGRKQLLAGDASGVRRMVKGELLVLVVIEIYCAVSLRQGMSPLVREAIDALDMPDAVPTFRLAFAASYAAFALLTIVYQGGMARYYSRQAGPVRMALEARSRPANAAPEDEVT